MIHRLHDDKLLTELRNYGAGERAYDIYRDCKRMGHHKIAARIKDKYGAKFPKPKHFDSIMAFQIALLAAKCKI